MKIERIVLRQLRMPLVHFFETSFSRTYEREIIIVEVVSEGISGWGEITAGEHPFYNEEWTAVGVADRAGLCRAAAAGPRDRPCATKWMRSRRHIRGHNMARGGVEAAVWDLQARRNGNPLWKEIGGGRAARDSLRRIDRDSGFGGAVDRKDRDANWPPVISASR